MNKSGGNHNKEAEIISILLVDDIPEARENIKKMIAFEPDMKVIGSVGTGREGVEMAKQIKPDIIIMDINMPDMDGIQATGLITEAVPTTAVIMMSVQNDPDYFRRAMLAGARYFLPKPVSMDELYNTIRTVHQQYKPIREKYNAIASSAAQAGKSQTKSIVTDDNRPGHIIVVYSPQGGVGCTTICTNLASGLMRDGMRVLLVDADLQFGDIDVHLNLSSKSTIVDLASTVDDLDLEHFDHIVVTHDSGLKVLLGPPRPDDADEIIQTYPTSVAKILQKVANRYDFIIVDTSSHLDDVVISLFDVATKIMLVGTPTISAMKNIRFVLDLFDKAEFAAEKIMIAINRVPTDRNQQKYAINKERAEKFLKQTVTVEIPSDELTSLMAVRNGVPMVMQQRERGRSPIREMMQLVDVVQTTLMGVPEEAADEDKSKETAARGPFGLRFGRS
jgi:pilus assembly protein CpaE